MDVELGREGLSIYVRLPNWVGDVLLATPFLRALRQIAPRAQVIGHGKRGALELLAPEGLIDRPLPLQGAGGLLGPWREGRRVRREVGRPDLALLLPNSFSSALLAWATGAPERVGYALNGRGQLLTRGLPVKREGRLRPIPMVDYYLALLDSLGAPLPPVERRPLLRLDAPALARGQARLRALGVPEGSRPWAINLGGAWETKRWIPAHAGALVRLLRAEGVVPLLLWGPGEEGLRDEVLAAAGGEVPGGRDMISLPDLAPTLAHCELMISTDSGPRHFGVAAGVPVLVLIGSTHPGYTRVDYAPLELLCEEVECWPCHLKRCPIDFRCMQRLGPEKVLGAARALLARVGEPA